MVAWRSQPNGSQEVKKDRQIGGQRQIPQGPASSDLLLSVKSHLLMFSAPSKIVPSAGDQMFK